MRVDHAIEAYLQEVDAQLELPESARHRVLEEIRGHLIDAIDDARRRGVDATDATRRAIEDFGPPTAVASQFDEPGAPVNRRIATGPHPRGFAARVRLLVLATILSIPLLVDLAFWFRIEDVPHFIANGRRKWGIWLVSATTIHLIFAYGLWRLHQASPRWSNAVVLFGGAAYLVACFFVPPVFHRLLDAQASFGLLQ